MTPAAPDGPPPPPRGSATLAASDRPLAERHDLALLDLDGVVYIGPDAVPGAEAALTAARAAGQRLAFVTNNASRPPGTVAEHLVRLGIPALESEVVTSAQVAAAILARRLPAGAPVLVIGGLGLEQALTAEGLRPVTRMEDDPQAVVQGFSPDLDWHRLAEGTRAVRAGLPWVATNLDLTVPTPYGPAPGNGSLIGVVAAAAGRGPDEVAGKPAPAAFRETVARLGAHSPLVVGDRLDTDLEGAVAAGIPGLLVFTGVSGLLDAVTGPPQSRPHYLGADLGALLEPHPEVEVGDGKISCRSAAVELVGDRIAVLAAGTDPLDLARAGCVAGWRHRDAQRVQGDVTPGVPECSELLAAVGSLAPGQGWVR